MKPTCNSCDHKDRCQKKNRKQRACPKYEHTIERIETKEHENDIYQECSTKQI